MRLAATFFLRTNFKSVKILLPNEVVLNIMAHSEKLGIT